VKDERPCSARLEPGEETGKPALRRRFLEARLTLGRRAAVLGRRVQQALLAESVYQQADVLMLYLAFRGEVSTDLILETALAQGKVVAAPVTLKEERRLVPLRLEGGPGELCRGAYGILEPHPSLCRPVAPGDLDLVVVPGVAFDCRGGRLGYGGGYYDRFLRGEAAQARRAALAFEVQVSEGLLPLDPYDAVMDLVVTERRVIRGSRPA